VVAGGPVASHGPPPSARGKELQLRQGQAAPAASPTALPTTDRSGSSNPQCAALPPTSWSSSVITDFQAAERDGLRASGGHRRPIVTRRSCRAAGDLRWSAVTSLRRELCATAPATDGSDRASTQWAPKSTRLGMRRRERDRGTVAERFGAAYVRASNGRGRGVGPLRHAGGRVGAWLPRGSSSLDSRRAD
jgi:hypothetical protein